VWVWVWDKYGAVDIENVIESKGSAVFSPVIRLSDYSVYFSYR